MSDHRYHMTLQTEGVPRPLDLGLHTTLPLARLAARGDMKARHGEPTADDWAASTSADGEEWVLPATCGSYHLTPPRES